MKNKIKDLDELKNILYSGNKLKLKIKVIAGSKTNSIEFSEEFVKIKISQRPMEGKANIAIVNFLSCELKFPKSKIVILNGHKSQIKTIELG